MDHGAFTVEPRTLHTKHTASATGVDIEILSPPALFQGSFDAATPIVMVNGVRVLHPVRILDAKCRSLLSRSHDVKRASDAEDIAFLLHRCASDGIKIRAGDMVNAIPGVLESIIDQAWVPRQAWNAAGYVDGGTSSLCCCLAHTNQMNAVLSRGLAAVIQSRNVFASVQANHTRPSFKEDVISQRGESGGECNITEFTLVYDIYYTGHPEILLLSGHIFAAFDDEPTHDTPTVRHNNIDYIAQTATTLSELSSGLSCWISTSNLIPPPPPLPPSSPAFSLYTRGRCKPHPFTRCLRT